jgi:hypothetical protein
LSQTTIKFESPFQAPIVRAQFDVLLVLAEAMAPSLADLSKVASDWQRVVAVAADALAAQSANVKSVAHAIPIWNRVLNDLGVASLTPAATAILDTITERLATAVRIPYAGEHRLERSHEAAVGWIRDLGVRRGLAALQQATAYPIRVHYNPAGDDYCASSSLFANEIGWNLQLVERALYGALILDMLFEHEYLSHLLPRNNFLSKNVREIWLSAALFWECVELPGDPAEKHVQEALWELFRRELNKHFDPKNLEFFGPWKLDHLAEQIYFVSPDVFWDITKAILECDDNRNNADVIDAFLRQLLSLRPGELRSGLALRPAQWTILQEFHERLAK